MCVQEEGVLCDCACTSGVMTRVEILTRYRCV